MKIAQDFSLPTDAVTQTIAILAKRGGGKTHTAGVINEEMIKRRIPTVVLDPTGAWFGLRSGKDGTAKGGLPVYVIGGAHGIPLEPTAGKVIAAQVVMHPANYVLDLSHFESNAAQDRFATQFAEELYRMKAKHHDPVHLFIDEADSFIPQRPMPGQQAMLGAFEALSRRGRSRGIGITLISQRPAVINKNVLTQTECLIVLQTTGPQDGKAIEEWVKLNCSEEQRREFMGSLAKLKRGEAWLWSPSWLETFRLIHVRDRQTFNSSATPKAGERAIAPELSTVDMDALSAEIRATMERAKENDPDELKRQIRALKAEIAKKPQAPAADPDEIKKLKCDIEILEREAEQREEKFTKFRSTVGSIIEKVQNAIEETVSTTPIDLRTLLSSRTPAKEVQHPTAPARPQSPRTAVYQTQPEAGEDSIRSGARRMLAVLIRCFPNSESEGTVRARAGLKKSGTYGTYKSDLITQNLIVRTPEGLAATNLAVYRYGSTVEKAPETTEEVLAIWTPKLRSGARRMLDVLIRERRALTDRELAELAGMAAGSGTYGTYKSDLRTAKLITVSSGMIEANAQTLFL